MQLDWNDLVVICDDGHWFVLFSCAKVTVKETSISTDCYFSPIQMKRDFKNRQRPAGCLLEFSVRTVLARSNSGLVHKREINRPLTKVSAQIKSLTGYMGLFFLLKYIMD